jgi:hypothetical protein
MDSTTPLPGAGQPRPAPDAPDTLAAPDGGPDRLRTAVARAAADAARASALWDQGAAARGRAGERAGELAGAADAALRAARAARDDLRAAVSAYAARLRADGAPPERMLVAVKGAVGADAPPPAGSDAAAGARAVMDDAVRWSIEAYYARG